MEYFTPQHKVRENLFLVKLKNISDLTEQFLWNHRFIIHVRVSNLIMLTTSCHAEAI